MPVKIIGVDATATGDNTGTNYFFLQKFVAEVTWNMDEFRVKSNVSGNVKCAVYADNGAGEPGALITAMNTGQAVVAGQWNILSFTSTPITIGTIYWLAICISITGAALRASTGGVRRYKVVTYSTFTFPNPAGAGFTADEALIIVAGWGSNLILQTFYPTLGHDGVAADGLSYRQVLGGESWASLHDSIGEIASDTANLNTMRLATHPTPNMWGYLCRVIMNFDTLLLPPSIQIAKAVVGVRVSDCGGDNRFPDIAIVEGSTADPSKVTVADYLTLGTVPLTNVINIVNLIKGTYHRFTFNPAYHSVIKSAAVTKLGVRDVTYDAPNTPWAWVAATGYSVIWNARDQGIGLGPYLEVVYEIVAAGVGEPGHVWVEGIGLHYLDANGAEVTKEGVLTGQVGTAGHLWVEGDYIHYIDQGSNERRVLGTQEGAVGKVGGHVWIESTKFRYIDSSGNERYI